jgi:hypothetical protein
MEELVAHENITIYTNFEHMASNLNYTTDPCENTPNNCSWPWIGNTKDVIVTKKAQ